ncbi:MAG: hypothetical protein RIE24_19560 [Silicimonas sp.]
MGEPAIVRSAFDSDIFGVEFFRVVTPDTAAVVEAVRNLTAERFILDAKFPADELDRAAALDAAGFRKASTLVEFATAPYPRATRDPEQASELRLGDDDLDAHAAGFRFQRFMQDGRIPKAGSEALVRRWIANSLSGRRETLAIGRNFCTFAVDEGRLTIDLLSCLDTGQGMSGRLLACIHAEAASRGCGEVRVSTEAENAPAMRAYVRAGFRPVRSWAAMHLVQLAGGTRP